MTKRGAMAWLLLLGAVAGFPAEVLDRIVATVNGRPIVQSQWEDEVRWEAFSAGRKLAEVTSADEQAALQRLVDQELVRQQMTTMEITQAQLEDAKAKIKDFRSQIPGAQEDGAWQRMLAEYGLEEGDVIEHLRVRLSTLRFIDARLRSTAHVNKGAVERYYKDTFLPELRKAGGKEVPLAQVSAKITEILTQQQIDDSFNIWLHNIRQQSQIRLGAPGEAQTPTQP